MKIPDGWKLVPVKATYEMLQAINYAILETNHSDLDDILTHERIYNALLSEIPEPPLEDS